jgi:hypothetical protein
MGNGKIDTQVSQAIGQYTNSLFTKVVDPLVYLFVVFSFLYFFWFAMKSLWGGGNDVASIKENRSGMLWGVVGLTVMMTAIALTWFAGNTGTRLFGGGATNGLNEVQYIKINGR